jgi:tetratricopeptide (TPR) repeat protein
MAQTDNAITRRADEMQQMWRDFLENPTARTCYWVVEPDEERMMDVFYIANTGDSHKTPDMFLRLEAPFKDISTYGSMLSETLAYLMDLERPSFEAYEIPLKWQSEHQEDPSNRALGFLRNFFRLASELNLGEGVVVAFLDPQVIKRKDEWERWCFDATRLNLPDKIRLMFVETEGKQTLQKLAGQYPQRIHVIKPNLDMNGAVRELLHETGDQTDKGTHFQHAFFELGQCIAQKDMAGMKVHAEKAIGISRNMGYPHLEIAVLCATANGFLANQQPKVAITVYDEAFRVAQAARDKPLIPELPDLKMDDSNGNIFDQLSVQALFSKGTALITQRPPQYQAAFEVYQQADGLLQDMISKKQDFAKEKMDFETGGALLMHRVEALRLSGFCLEGLKQGKKALDIYVIAVSLAEKWTPEIRKGSTLPFIGQAMMKLYHEFAMKQAFHATVQKMNFLLGDDWEKKLPKK